MYKASFYSFIILYLVFSIALPSLVSAESGSEKVKEEEVLTNETIIKMVKADLGEAIIISKIKNSKINFDLSTDGILKLKEAGVGEKVIEAMMGKKERPAEVKMQEITSPSTSGNSQIHKEQKKGDTQSGGYLSIKGGLYDPDINYDTAYNAEVAVGIKVNPYFIIDIGGGYFRSEYKSEYSDWFGSSIKEKLTYSLIPITLTLKGNVPLGGDNVSGYKVELYGGGGIGYYLAKKEYKYTSDTLTESYSSDANALGYHAVIGVDFNVAKHFALGIEGKWFKVEPEFDYEVWGFKVINRRTTMGGWVYNAGFKIRF